MPTIKINWFLELLVVSLTMTIACRGNNGLQPAAPETFEGTSPGVMAQRAFLKIPANERCDFIRWKLMLYRKAGTQAPESFKLEREYGYYVDNRTDRSMGQTTIEGTWGITSQASPKPGAVVYRLRSGGQTIDFYLLDQQLLHLLNTDGSLMVGNGGQSFTLSREGSSTSVASSSKAIYREATFSSGIKDTVLKYEGRSPCKAIAKDQGLSSPPGCFKLKWLLTLHQDPVTHRPTRYHMRRVISGLNEIEGSWTMVQGTKRDSNAIVFRIDAPAQQPGPSLYLLKGDDNVLFFLDKEGNLLVGDSLFSYTLNRRTSR